MKTFLHTIYETDLFITNYEKPCGIMSNADYKSKDALMRHLRGNGIAISGT